MANFWGQNHVGPTDACSTGTQTARNGPHRPHLRSIGVLIEKEHEFAAYFELEFLHLMKQYATDMWPSVSGGDDQDSLDLTKKLYVALELDEKAIMDLMLLAQSGEVGRAEYNYLVWKLITEIAIEPPYKDLSHKVSQMALIARGHFDRPPAQNWGLRAEWGWSYLMKPRFWDWSPCAVPDEYLRGDEQVLTGEGGMPFEPPWCYKEDLRKPFPHFRMVGPQDLDLTRDPRPAEERNEPDASPLNPDGPHEGWRSRSS